MVKKIILRFALKIYSGFNVKDKQGRIRPLSICFGPNKTSDICLNKGDSDRKTKPNESKGIVFGIIRSKKTNNVDTVEPK